METTKKARGFASMDPEKQRAIARKGGESVPREKRSFSQNAELAAEAGRKGGRSVSPTNRSFARDKDLAKKRGTQGRPRRALRRHRERASLNKKKRPRRASFGGPPGLFGRSVGDVRPDPFLGEIEQSRQHEQEDHDACADALALLQARLRRP